MEFAIADAGEGEGATVELAGDPSAGKHEVQEGGSEGAGEMGAALAPVQAGVSETAAPGAGVIEVDAEAGEGTHTVGSEVVGGGAAGGANPAGAQEPVVEGDGDGSGHMVVTGTSSAKMGRGTGDQAAVRAAGENAELLEGAGDGRAGEGVVAMASLGEDTDEVFGEKPVEMDAGGGRGDGGNETELGAGASAAIDERVKHAGAGRFADGGGDGGDGGIDGRVRVSGSARCIHTLTVNEV
jgi:hypothetical protein